MGKKRSEDSRRQEERKKGYRKKRSNTHGQTNGRISGIPVPIVLFSFVRLIFVEIQVPMLRVTRIRTVFGSSRVKWCGRSSRKREVEGLSYSSCAFRFIIKLYLVSRTGDVRGRLKSAFRGLSSSQRIYESTKFLSGHNEGKCLTLLHCGLLESHFCSSVQYSIECHTPYCPD